MICLEKSYLFSDSSCDLIVEFELLRRKSDLPADPLCAILCSQFPLMLDSELTTSPFLALSLLNVSLHCISETPSTISSSMNLGGGNGGGGESALESGIVIGRCAFEKGFISDGSNERS